MTFEKILSFLSIFIILLFIARTLIHYSLTKENPLTIGSGKDSFRNIKERIAVLGLVLFIIFSSVFGFIEILHKKIPLISQLDKFPYRVSGLFLTGLTLFFFIVALFQMRKSWRVGIDENTKDPLITSGVFSFSRNPIYLSMDLIFIGYFLTVPNWIFLGAAILGLIGIHLQIKEEEKFLLKHYGSSYSEYCKQTGRYLSVGTFKI